MCAEGLPDSFDRSERARVAGQRADLFAAYRAFAVVQYQFHDLSHNINAFINCAHRDTGQICFRATEQGILPPVFYFQFRIALCQHLHAFTVVDKFWFTASQTDQFGGFVEIFIRGSFPDAESCFRQQHAQLFFGFEAKHGDIVAGIFAIAGLSAHRQDIAESHPGEHFDQTVTAQHAAVGLYPKAFQ